MAAAAGSDISVTSARRTETPKSRMEQVETGDFVVCVITFFESFLVVTRFRSKVRTRYALTHSIFQYLIDNKLLELGLRVAGMLEIPAGGQERTGSISFKGSKVDPFGGYPGAGSAEPSEARMIATVIGSRPSRTPGPLSVFAGRSNLMGRLLVGLAAPDPTGGVRQMPEPRILVFAGSAREGSFNKRLARVALAAVQATGANGTFIDLKDFPMPIYIADLEAAGGMPSSVLMLKTLLREHDGLLISSPENNASVSALLKNTLDWLSRPIAAEKGIDLFQGKPAAIVAASPGALGGIRGLFHLRQILTTLNMLVLPEQFALGKANEAFDENGSLKHRKDELSVVNVAVKLVTLARKLAAK
jgi:NAD(P)H-dependent FMN reductase